MVDVSYGGEQGFNQAIEMSADTLTNVKLLKEKKTQINRRTVNHTNQIQNCITTACAGQSNFASEKLN